MPPDGPYPGAVLQWFDKKPEIFAAIPNQLNLGLNF